MNITSFGYHGWSVNDTNGNVIFPYRRALKALRLPETDDRHEGNDGDLFARCSSVVRC